MKLLPECVVILDGDSQERLSRVELVGHILVRQSSDVMAQLVVVLESYEQKIECILLDTSSSDNEYYSCCYDINEAYKQHSRELVTSSDQVLSGPITCSANADHE